MEGPRTHIPGTGVVVTIVCDPGSAHIRMMKGMPNRTRTDELMYILKNGCCLYATRCSQGMFTINHHMRVGGSRSMATNAQKAKHGQHTRYTIFWSFPAKRKTKAKIQKKCVDRELVPHRVVLDCRSPVTSTHVGLRLPKRSQYEELQFFSYTFSHRFRTYMYVKSTEFSLRHVFVV